MAALKLSDEEKQQLRDDAKSEIERLEQYLQKTEDVKIVDAFKNRFNICESAYKIVLAKHQSCKGKQPTDFLKIDMRQAPQALAFAGYAFDKQLLSDLFGAAPSAKGRTAKKLRDGTTHSIDESAVNEIVSRKDELFGYMDTFLETIKTFDAVAA